MDSDRLNTVKPAAIQAYVAAGFRVFNAGGGPEGKAPVGYCWYNGHPPDTLGEYYGVVLGDEVLVIDYDPRRDAAVECLGDETQIQKLWRELGLPPANTYIVKTGSGGYHLYFTKPSDIQLRSSVPGYGAIDVKSGERSYVLGAYSNHHSGNLYIPLHGSPDQLSACPPALLELITRPPNENNRGSVVDDSEETKRVFAQFLRTTAPAVSGQGGNNQTFQTAAHGRDLGLSKESTLVLMWGIYNERCQPQWDENELRAIVDHAYEYSQNQQGYLNPRVAFASVIDELPDIESLNAIREAFNENADPLDLSDQLATAHNENLHWTRSLDRHTGLWKFDPTLNNAINFFKLMPHSGHDNPLYKLMRYNRFSGVVEFTRPAPWHDPDCPTTALTDTDVLMLKEYFTHKTLYVSTELVREACIIVSQQNAYHPIRDYLNSLVWDQTPRLDEWLHTYAGSPLTRYTREIGKNTLIAAVARIMRPGCQHDSMLILEGPQNAGKTSICRILGGEWFGDPKIEPGAKDTVVRVQGKWILEMSEMEVLKRAEISALKKFLTSIIDTERLPYARFACDLPRQCIFIGTINPQGNGYLQDPTGNRRFWGVQVGRIDLPALTRDRDQLFAEAAARYRAGEPWWITDPDIQIIAASEQDARMQGDLWNEAIEDWVTNNPMPFPLTTRDVAYQALMLAPNRVDRVASDRICNALRACGFERVRIRANGVRVWHWQRFNEQDPTVGLI